MLEAVRTPSSHHGGAFREEHPGALLTHASGGLVGRAGLDSGDRRVVNDTFSPTGDREANVGQLGMMLADFPVIVPAVALNRTCGPSRSHSRS